VPQTQFPTTFTPQGDGNTQEFFNAEPPLDIISDYLYPARGRKRMLY